MKTLITALFGLLLAANVSADHEPDHRYNVRGYVLDENEKPIPDQTVQALLGSKVMGSTRTDDSGYYSIHLHLHNADLARTLTLQAGEQEAEIQVTFDPGDRSSARTHDVNLVGGKLVETGLGRFRVPPLVYAIAGVLVLFVIAFALETRRKKKRRQTLTVQAAAQSPAGKKKRKRKRSRR